METILPLTMDPDANHRRYGREMSLPTTIIIIHLLGLGPPDNGA
jgi:hypothetical protein